MFMSKKPSGYCLGLNLDKTDNASAYTTGLKCVILFSFKCNIEMSKYIYMSEVFVNMLML